jgi:HPt (histidine-containing phosphotransfer) domain-containing protein
MATGFAAQLAEDLDAEDLQTVLGVFRDDAASLGAAIAAAAGAGDGFAFRRACHSLAGAAAAVGATTLEQACRHGMVEASQGATRLPARLAALAAEIVARTEGACAEAAALLATR